MDDTRAPTDRLPEAAIHDVPVTLTISVGRARTAVGTLLTLGANSVIPLDRAIDDPVEIFAGNQLVALGELIETEGEAGPRLAVRIIELTKLGAAD